MTVKETAQRLGLTPAQVTNLLRVGRLTGTQASGGRGVWSVDSASVEQYASTDRRPGAKAKPKVPKVPGKPGRPAKPRRPRGRPRKG